MGISFTGVGLPDDVVEVTELILNSMHQDFDVTYLEDRLRTLAGGTAEEAGSYAGEAGSAGTRRRT